MDYIYNLIPVSPIIDHPIIDHPLREGTSLKIPESHEIPSEIPLKAPY
jgi:hypothetical protein